MLRNAFVLSLVGLSAGLVHAQAVGDACTDSAETPFALQCSDTGTLLFCATEGAATTGTVDEVDCTFPDTDGDGTVEDGETPANPNGTCGATQCTDTAGDGCTAFGAVQNFCLADSGEFCGGVAVWFDADAANDNNVGFPSCQNDEACVIGGGGETCTNTVPACTADSAPLGCEGDTLFLCLFGQSEDSDGDGTLEPDATPEPEVDEDGDGVIDAYLLPNSFGLNCATAFETAGSCADNVTEGPMHDALTGLGFDVTGQALPDCVLPNAGEGEGEGEGGEGEGEGGEGEGERDDEEGGDEDPPSGGACGAFAQGGTPLALLAALGLAIRRRRR